MARVLVACASKHGSTIEIADAIASELREHGLDVDRRDAAEASAAGYDAVILGSAVYMGRWRKDARRFLSHEKKTLAGMPFWIFSSGPFGEQAQHPSARDQKWSEPEKVVAKARDAGVRGRAVFGGRLPTEPHGFVEQAMVRDTPPETRDMRDWAKIREWAAEIADELAAPV